ncbi:DUF2169 domain-containing protein [Polyangium jinanense]|uniref:DUF2169 domain-containing protein n=1 Tax=Polyangium jinanense TaxID=2829994 RepID=A0A9X4AXM7_9BACT|nr:DUF2169 domain-containing protein [Polyangium jinanense]MDC3988086.1 DUF2169 domain-containing protein [Polyangium jinanense]
MKFVNETPLPAAMIPNGEEDDRITALFLCAITLRIASGGLELVPGQRPLLLDARSKVPNDVMFSKEATSVCATGFVYPRRGDRAREATASLRVGSSDMHIQVFGTRVWQRGALGGLTPSSPVPFERVAMSWENAYGGVTKAPAAVVEMDGEEAFVPEHESGYPLNFDGKGFYTDEARAENQPLPQLEDPAALVRAWDDHPEPVCFAPYPLWGGMRAKHVVKGQELDMTGIRKLGSRAAPRMTFDTIGAGTEIVLAGMRPGGGALSFVVPRSPVVVAMSVGGMRETIVPRLDAVDIDAEACEARFVFRAKATYGLVQFEERRAVLSPSEFFPKG